MPSIRETELLPSAVANGAASRPRAAPRNSSGPALLFQDQIVGWAVRPPRTVFDLGALLMALKGEPDLPIVALCSYCRRLRRPGADDEWVSVETYYRLGGASRVRISHSLCADCDAVRFPER